MRKKVMLITAIVLALGISTVYAATSPYGTIFGFNLAKININNQEAPLKAIDVNGQIYVPIQMYVQEMNGTYTYDFNNYVINITSGTGQTTGTNNPYSPSPYTQDPYGYNSGSYNPYNPTGYSNSNPYGYGTPTGYGQTPPPQSTSGGYQNYQSPFYDPRYDYEILYDIIPYRDAGERYHIGFIQEDLESLEAFLEEIERMHEEMDAVFESSLDKYNNDMSLEEAERRNEIRMNTYKILDKRFKDLMDEVEDIDQGSQSYEDLLEDAIKEMENALDDQKDALKYLSKYMDYKKSTYRERFTREQNNTMTNLNQAMDYLDQAADQIEDALDALK